jgi:hypothetical protein
VQDASKQQDCQQHRGQQLPADLVREHLWDQEGTVRTPRLLDGVQGEPRELGSQNRHLTQNWGLWEQGETSE